MKITKYKLVSEITGTYVADGSANTLKQILKLKRELEPKWGKLEIYICDESHIWGTPLNR